MIGAFFEVSREDLFNRTLTRSKQGQTLSHTSLKAVNSLT